MAFPARVLQMVREGVTDPDHQPTKPTVLDAWRVVTMVRDGALVAMGGLLCWTVYTVQQQQIDIAAMKASRFTFQDGVNLKDGISLAMGAQREAQDAKLEAVREILSRISTDTAEIKGRLSIGDSPRIPRR